MRIHYIEPLSKGIARAKKDLFNPLDFKKWFIVGFTAFLAKLADVEFSLGIPDSPIRKTLEFNLEDALYAPQRFWEWLGDHPVLAMVIGFALFALCIFLILLTWLSSRGKFMFLDNIVRGQSRVVAPWYEYNKEGNSFFWWNLLWGILVSAIVLTYISFCFVNFQMIYESSRSGRALILPAILAGIGFAIISIISTFLYVLLRDFVIQIMYRDRIAAWRAIQKFLPLFFSEFLHFIGYGLFRLLISMLIVIGVLIAGCVTCCVGFVVLAIPYIGSVVLLPVSYAMRSFSVEFFGQFGPEFQVFQNPDINPPSVAKTIV